jgi:hypothetical protein
MNKTLGKSLNMIKLNKSNFFQKLVISSSNNKIRNSNLYFINKFSKKQFSIDYADIEKKLDKFYEMQEKSKLEYIKSVMTEKEKRDAEVLFQHLENLDELEKDYFNVKLENEMRMQFDLDILKNQYKISNLDMFNPIEIDGNKFGFGNNLTKNISPFYGASTKTQVAGIFNY